MRAAPIALFAFKRLRHVRETVEALRKNDLAEESELFVFSDGPRSAEENAAVDSVRRYIRTIDGFKNVSVIEREGNLGLAQSVISGVSETVNGHGRVIVLEDDMVSSPYFLKFLNEALDLYENEERVISIHGYVYPVGAVLPETFFLRGADCWGWATWKRGWDLFEPDGKKLLAGLRNRALGNEFDFHGAYPYTRMLEDQISGKNDSWAVRWYASAFLQGRLTLYPGRSLIKNIGVDDSGTHLGATKIFDTEISRRPITLADIPVEEHRAARREFERYLRKANRGIVERIKGGIVRRFL